MLFHSAFLREWEKREEALKGRTRLKRKKIKRKKKSIWERSGVTHTIASDSFHVLEPHWGLSSSPPVSFVSQVLITWHAVDGQRPKVRYRMDPCQLIWCAVWIFSRRIYGKSIFFPGKKTIHINWLISAFQLAWWFLSTFHLNVVS